MCYLTQRYRDNVQTRYYSSNQGSPMYKPLTFWESDRIATNLACKLSEYTKGHKTVAFINDHNATYLIFMLAFFKLRMPVLCISLSNPVVSVVNLLSKTNASLVFTNKKFLNLANDSAKKIPGIQVVQNDEMDLGALAKEPLDHRAKDIINTHFSDEDLSKAVLITQR
jgi:long-subunit acyl-CoA synthetase (AMP-forming)